MPTPKPEVYAPSSRYRSGDRDGLARRVHATQSCEWRRDLASREFDPA